MLIRIRLYYKSGLYRVLTNFSTENENGFPLFKVAIRDFVRQDVLEHQEVASNECLSTRETFAVVKSNFSSIRCIVKIERVR